MTPPTSARLVLLCIGCLTAACLGAPAASAVTREELSAYSTEVQRSWAAMTDAGGAVHDALEPARGRFSYGTLMLAQAQLRAAARTGDDRLGDAAVAQVLATISRDGPQDPFYLLGAATTVADGRRGVYRPRDWQRIASPLAAWLGRFEPYTGQNFTDPAHYSNWKLVWSTGALALAGAGVAPSSSTAIAADPAALRAEVRRIVSTLAVASAAPRATASGRRPLRALSDRVSFPNAYHVFSVYLLERVFAADPGVFTARALRLREEAARYTLTLMAPDGQLTHAGRSLEQSWVLAAAASLRGAPGGGGRASGALLPRARRPGRAAAAAHPRTARSPSSPGCGHFGTAPSWTPTRP